MEFATNEGTPLAWLEPPFFSARTRDWRGWIIRGVVLVLGFIFLLFVFLSEVGVVPEASTSKAFLLAGIASLGLPVLLELPIMSRVVTIHDDRIVAANSEVPYLFWRTWRLRDVRWARLIPPEESGRSFGVMEFATALGRRRVGSPAGLSMSRIAETLAARGVAVTLSGWHPGIAESEAHDQALAAMEETIPSISARIERLDHQESQTLTQAFVMLAIMVGPALVCAGLGLVLLGPAIYELRIKRAPLTTSNLSMLVGGVALIIGALGYFARIGLPVSQSYWNGLTDSILKRRRGSVVDPDYPDVDHVQVSIRTPREQDVGRSNDDHGLLRIDSVSRRLLFEGVEQRWIIPGASLISVRVEPRHSGGKHIEGDPWDFQSFHAVVRANVEGVAWEATIAPGPVDLQVDNSVREARAVALRDRIREIGPPHHGASRSKLPGMGA